LDELTLRLEVGSKDISEMSAKFDFPLVLVCRIPEPSEPAGDNSVVIGPEWWNGSKIGAFFLAVTGAGLSGSVPGWVCHKREK